MPNVQSFVYARCGGFLHQKPSHAVAPQHVSGSPLPTHSLRVPEPKRGSSNTMESCHILSGQEHVPHPFLGDKDGHGPGHFWVYTLWTDLFLLGWHDLGGPSTGELHQWRVPSIRSFRSASWSSSRVSASPWSTWMKTPPNITGDPQTVNPDNIQKRTRDWGWLEDSRCSALKAKDRRNSWSPPQTPPIQKQFQPRL